MYFYKKKLIKKGLIENAWLTDLKLVFQIDQEDTKIIVITL